ncbi:MAG TPA: HlyC/CorC family transporter [Leptolyngbyaceae cyanobacterium M65_K2018_010]|nr:HlyC/CorC family transporter [Leptolyngbyaceae cyanobacterium M65_K2018_010]
MDSFPILLSLVIPEVLPGSAVASRLLAVFLLIGINAFFVAAEFSIVSVRRSRISQLVSQGDVQAKTVQQLQRSLNRLLSTTQLGITLSSLALGWIGENTVAVLIAFWLIRTPLTQGQGTVLAHTLAIPIAFFLVAYLQIVLGELCPKSVALLYPEQLARFLGPPSLTIAKLFNPFIWILNQSTRRLLGIFRIQFSDANGYSRLTPEELQLLIRTTAETPGLEAEERELLNNVFEFRDVTAGEIMIPRTQIHTLDASATLADLLNAVATTEHSRYPVVGDSLDDIQGLVDLKHLLRPLAQQEITLDTPIQPWVKPARFVPEFTPWHEILVTMQRTGQELVIVVDEFGGTAGLLTLRDLTTEIIGEIHPPGGEETEVYPLDGQSYRVKAQVDLYTLNELLGLELPYSDDYQTLAGFLIYQMQKIPHEGERLVYGDREWIILATDGPKLEEILVRPLDPLLKADLIPGSERTAAQGVNRDPDLHP